MKITSLVDNVGNNPRLINRYGLSYYIETDNHKLLFDAGPDDAFQLNANQLGIYIGTVELMVLSHGHYDHGDGLKTFLELNESAPVYIHKQAFGQHYSKLAFIKKYIGLDQSLKNSPRFLPTDGTFSIDDELTLFSNVPGKELLSPANKSLMVQVGNDLQPDQFDHEQNLIITEGNNTMLIAGCAHKGILNILEAADKIAGRPVTHAFGGFHLITPVTEKATDKGIIDEIGLRLLSRPTRYWTCHCTGLDAFGRLKSILGNQISYLSTGMTVEI